MCSAACCGDTGCFPIAMSLIETSLKYFKRVSELSINNTTSLVGRAFNEQNYMNLNWYKAWATIKSSNISQRDRVTNSSIRNNSEPSIKEHFLTEWKNSLRNQSKLEFYRRVKLNFGLESLN